MALLETLTGPGELRGLSQGQLETLAAEIRALLIEKVGASGGHLGPNLGVVELTLALHRVFDSPKDTLLWDTGHQTYVHKLLTGRQAGFDRLRAHGGLSGYASRAESPHDVIENSHASTALSYACGLAKARALAGVRDRAVVAVVGDGALTGGLAWEALNNLGGRPDLRAVLVLNDNGRSYEPTVGGIAAHLGRLRGADSAGGVGDVGGGAGNVFEQLGLAYRGPVDGHDTSAVEEALCAARTADRPVVVHVVTEKGRGWPEAEANQLDRCHVVRAASLASAASPTSPSWTSVFGEEIVRIGEQRTDVVALTAAMREPVGLLDFGRRFPDRTFDVGIAEQHAAVSAAGLALGGLHPVLALYATFANRAFDQLLMDVALHRCPVTLVMDRAGVTGDDGPSHNGMWDLSLCQAVPGLRVAAPRDATRLRELLCEAVAYDDGPTALRFPKGRTGADIPALDTHAGIDVLRNDPGRDVLVVTAGPMARLGLEVADQLYAQGLGATVVDPRWVAPVNPELVNVAAHYARTVTIEDNGRTGGMGAALSQALGDAGVRTPLRSFGLPQTFLEHGSRAQVLARYGLSTGDIARQILADAGAAGGDRRTDRPTTARN
ncbi:1-deoxy-D-xylulose-5-phosphate synthase [Streptomyces tubbatahanensis]|uniref:1-deoxy-D-xylulose-5-phosphate synthase n=1 Tax=Streptomyces tubbatahanensis TaxID=2923272 RepID=A0ABY3XMT4_9ACTN|nr:1-deoxy-D-xylulose-5-phosphate synthase [Streptomyces tubbatahanensis]UNS95731.1 1-deoxy-D-xylulose-5-phosphate synthase [Streptomyces tubbatahanensis]